jgi:cytochrome c peroxidase
LEVGRLLFFDKVVSGNRNISCATCHHPRFGTGDGLSLGIGEGGVGVGPDRTPGQGDSRVKKRIPRNAQGLWNIGAKAQTILMHDGRIAVGDTYENEFDTPAEEWLPTGFDDLLAVQAIFPMVAQFEMTGNLRENEIVGAVHDRVDNAWRIIEERVRSVEGYRTLFVESSDTITTPADINITHIGNALGAFMNHQWRSIDSPFDDFLAGNGDALTPIQKQGMELFYGKANCSSCHSGPWLSDNQFHALGLPTFGPGRTRLHNDLARDMGRLNESDALEDAYRFRTPMLRNVALTAPYGHNGAYPTLEGIIRHHLDPVTSREQWKPEMANLPFIPEFKAIDFVINDDRLEMARYTRALDIKPIKLNDNEVKALVEFMHALTGRTADLSVTMIPNDVPSGLPVDK